MPADPAQQVAAPRKRVGIVDVARAAGVSQSTASNALNNVGRVDFRTRERVRAVANRLGYRANRTARMLRGGRSGILALVNSLPTGIGGELPSLEYHMHLMLGATTRALAHGYAVVTLPLDPQLADVEDISPDGVVLADPDMESEMLSWLEQSGIPTVTTGRSPERARDVGSWIDNDLVDGCRRMLDLLERRGASRIALLISPPTRSYITDALDAYQAWCAARSVPTRIQIGAPVATQASAREATLALLRSDDPPDAIYTPLERQALGALRAATECGLRVPDDLLLAVGSDSGSVRSSTPAITALSLDPYRVGELAIKTLVSRIEGQPVVEERVTLPTRILERASTRPGGNPRR